MANHDALHVPTNDWLMSEYGLTQEAYLQRKSRSIEFIRSLPGSFLSADKVQATVDAMLAGR
jgi:hypothetical protein